MSGERSRQVFRDTAEVVALLEHVVFHVGHIIKDLEPSWPHARAVKFRIDSCRNDLVEIIDWVQEQKAVKWEIAHPAKRPRRRAS